MHAMIPLRAPFRRWPWHWHALAAGVLVLLVVAAAFGWLRSRQMALAVLRAQYETVKEQRDAAARVGVPVPAPDFRQMLPRSSAADKVVRDMTMVAQVGGVQIQSLTVERQAASSAQLGRVRFNVAAVADYRSAKAWLAELLARHPSLAVLLLSMRASAGESGRQDVQLTLVLFVKD